jgi:DNA repair protein RadC
VNDGRAEQFGPSAWSDAEAIAAIIGPTGAGMECAETLLMRAGSLERLAGMATADFRQIKGITSSLAVRLVAAFECGRRVGVSAGGHQPLLTRADLCFAYLHPICQSLEVEKFFCLCLNRKNRLLRRVEITSGTATAALVHPREVFRAAIRESSSAIICAHNHPSGDPAPSSADVQITQLLREAARTVEITLLDHVIIGRPGADPLGRGFYSFRESGLL